MYLPYSFFFFQISHNRGKKLLGKYLRSVRSCPSPFSLLPQVFYPAHNILLGEAGEFSVVGIYFSMIVVLKFCTKQGVPWSTNVYSIRAVVFKFSWNQICCKSLSLTVVSKNLCKVKYCNKVSFVLISSCPLQIGFCPLLNVYFDDIRWLHLSTSLWRIPLCYDLFRNYVFAPDSLVYVTSAAEERHWQLQSSMFFEQTLILTFSLIKSIDLLLSKIIILR